VEQVIRSMFASWIFLLAVAVSLRYDHCSDNVDAGIPKACFNSVSETKKLSNSLLPQDQYDLRVVTFNTYDWNARRNQFERIKKWLKEVLPTVHVIAFQEFGHDKLDGFVRNFGLTPIKKRSKTDKMIYIRSNLIQEYSDEVTYTKRNEIGKDSCKCNQNWDRGVDIARIKVGNHQVYLANNHGCVGGCGGSATAYGGSAIIEVLNEQGFFTNEGAHSIFLGDVNYWHSTIHSNDPTGLCAPQIHGSVVGKMSVRGKLECGPGHPFDYVAYGRGFRAKKHYSFSGGGKDYNGDSDHKAVMLDLVFTDNYKPSGDIIKPSVNNAQRVDEERGSIRSRRRLRAVEDRIVVNYVGKHNCSSSPCSDGESDCDNDNECKGDLICWRRSNGETDPRYDTSGIGRRADICVRPEKSVSESGEDVCEGHGFDRATCVSISCCHWNWRGQCRSSIGTATCCPKRATKIPGSDRWWGCHKHQQSKDDWCWCNRGYLWNDSDEVCEPCEQKNNDPVHTTGSCMYTMACNSKGHCASCQARVDWLKRNRGKSEYEARQQIADEFPDKCNCDSHDQAVAEQNDDPVGTKSCPEDVTKIPGSDNWRKCQKHQQSKYGFCWCDAGYVWSGSDEVCEPCERCPKKATKIPGSDRWWGWCHAHQQSIDKACWCDPGYLWSGSDEVCKPCEHKSQASFVEVAVASKPFNARIIVLGGLFTLVAFLFLRSRKHAQEKGVYHALMDASEEEI